jgi:hypothetical protein
MDARNDNCEESERSEFDIINVVDDRINANCAESDECGKSEEFDILDVVADRINDVCSKFDVVSRIRSDAEIGGKITEKKGVSVPSISSSKNGHSRSPLQPNVEKDPEAGWTLSQALLLADLRTSDGDDLHQADDLEFSIVAQTQDKPRVDIPFPPLSEPQPVVYGLPGAYHIQNSLSGGGDDVHFDDTPSEDDSGNDTSLLPIDGLAVAQPVDPEARLDLPQADFVVDDIEAARKRQEKSKQFKTKILIVIIICIALVIMILLAVLIPTQKPAMATSDEMSSSQAPAPLSKEGHLLSLFPDDIGLLITENLDSPQSKAFQWLLENLQEHIESLPDDSIKQRFVLTTLYFATNGDTWMNNTNWLKHDVHECQWFTQPSFALKHTISKLFPQYLDAFHPSSEPTPTSCDNKGLYQHLWLDQNALEGALPKEIFLLTSLQSLSLGSNQIHGTISSHVGQLTLLEGLSISDLKNQAGEIPRELGLLTNLRALALRNSDHQGSIPTELWQLTTIEYLFMGDNPKQRSIIPTEIGNMLSLKVFGVDSNDLTGKFTKGCLINFLA